LRSKKKLKTGAQNRSAEIATRPNGPTLIPWQGAKFLTWDVTVVSTLADTYLHASSHSAGDAAEIASVRKEPKYSLLPPDYIFQQVAFETLGSLNSSGYDFLCEVGRRLIAVSGDAHVTCFLFRRLSILSQRFNSVLIIESFCFNDEDLDLQLPQYLFLASCFQPSGLIHMMAKTKKNKRK